MLLLMQLNGSPTSIAYTKEKSKVDELSNIETVLPVDNGSAKQAAIADEPQVPSLVLLKFSALFFMEIM